MMKMNLLLSLFLIVFPIMAQENPDPMAQCQTPADSWNKFCSDFKRNPPTIHSKSRFENLKNCTQSNTNSLECKRLRTDALQVSAAEVMQDDFLVAYKRNATASADGKYPIFSDFDERCKDFYVRNCKHNVWATQGESAGLNINVTEHAVIAQDKDKVKAQSDSKNSSVLPTIPTLAERACLDSNSQVWFTEKNSYRTAEQCDEFDQTLVNSKQNKSFGSGITELMSKFIGGNGDQLESFIGINGSKDFCDECFGKKYKAVRSFKFGAEKPEKQNNWIKNIDSAKDIREARNRAGIELSNHLSENIIKQEFLKISVVMEQFVHAKALTPNFKANAKTQACMNFESLQQKIEQNCGSKNKIILNKKFQNVFQALGMNKSELSQVGKDYKLGIENGLNFIMNKVSTYSKQDDAKACGEVKREDVARNQRFRAVTKGYAKMGKLFLDSLLATGDTKKFTEYINDPSLDPVTALSNFLRRSLNAPGSNPLKDMLSNKDGKYFTDEEIEKLQQNSQVKIPLNLDGSEESKIVIEKFVTFTPLLLSKMSLFNPNLFMFLNDPVIRKKFSQNKDDLVTYLLDPAVDESVMEQFAEKCEESFEKITQMACLKPGDLSPFTRTDLAIGAREVAKEINEAQPKRKALAQIGIGSLICMEKQKERKNNQALYARLDQQIPEHGQSDFMRRLKNIEIDTQPDPEDPKDALAQYKSRKLKAEMLGDAAANEAACKQNAIDLTNASYECALYHSDTGCNLRENITNNNEVFEDAIAAPPSVDSTKATAEEQAIINKKYQSYVAKRVESNYTPINGKRQKLEKPENIGNPLNRLETDEVAPLISNHSAPAANNLEPEHKPRQDASSMSSENNENVFSNPYGSANNAFTAPVQPSYNPQSVNESTTKPANTSTLASQNVKAYADNKESDKRRNKLLREINRLNNGMSPDFDELTDDELDSIKSGLMAKQESDQDKMKSLKAEYQQKIEELKAERAKLESEKQKHSEGKSKFFKQSPAATTTSTNLAKLDDAGRVPTFTNTSTQTTGRQTASVGNLGIPQSDSSSLESGNLATGKNGAKQFFSPKGKVSDPSYSADLSIYLDYVEQNKQITKADAIRFIQKDGEKYIEVPGPKGRIQIRYADIKDPKIIARIETLEKIQQADLQSEQNGKSVAEILIQEEENIKLKSENISKRIAIFEDLVQQLGN